MDINTIKVDLISLITNDKYYLEEELIRLADTQNLSYRERINKMNNILTQIAIINTKYQLINQYFDAGIDEEITEKDKIKEND